MKGPINGRRALSLLGALASLMVATISPAHAQRFAHMFGDTCHEYSFSGIHTADGGYLSVGSASSPSAGGSGCTGANEDIYIIKLNSNGSLAWSKTIDINGGNDVARDVIVSNFPNGGYLITGWTDNSGCSNMGMKDVFLLRISTTGTPTMLNVYGTADHNEMGLRIIECVRDANRRKFVGDIVIAGTSDDGRGNSDAYLLRTTTTGAVIFQNTYGGTSYDAFFGVTEAKFGTSAGDLIAAGQTLSFNPGGGFAVRVTPTGTIGTSPTGAAVYGCYRFTQVEELSVGTEAGRLVFCGDGYVNNIFGTYVKKTAADPCTSIADAWHGNANASATFETWNVREIKSGAGGGLNNGNLIIAGLTDVATGTPNDPDPFMLELTSGLAIVTPPTGVGFRVYGNTAAKGYTAVPVLASAGVSTAGFYLSASGIAPAGAMGAGSVQAYLIKTDNLGVVNCDDANYDVDEQTPDFTSTCPSITITNVGNQCGPGSTVQNQTWADTLCNDSLSGGTTGGGHGKLALVLLRDDGMELYPNPVATGSALTIATTMRDAGKMTVIVTDLAGKVVHRSSIDAAAGHATREVRTDGWRPGTYLVKTIAGDRTQQKKVVIGR